MPQPLRSELLPVEYSERDAREALMDWGEVIRCWGDSTPDGWGWPGVSIDPKRGGRGTAPGLLTATETAVDRLSRARAAAAKVSQIVRGMPLVHKHCIALHYVHQLDAPAIGVQIGLETRTVRVRIREGERTLAQALTGLARP